LKLLFSQKYKAVLKVVLIVNDEKTEYMVLRRRDIPLCQPLKIGHYEFKRVNKFKYLGTILTTHNAIPNEVVARNQVGNKIWY